MKLQNTLCLLLLLAVTTIKAQSHFIPDQNFEKKLIELGIDRDGLNGEILDSTSEKITMLNLDNSNIQSLQGIEAFRNLQILSCRNNKLKQLNLSLNPYLTKLECDSNLLEEVNLGSNSNFTYLSISNNSFKNLSPNKLPKLNYLNCSNNNIETLVLSINSAIESLYCSNNKIRHIDLSFNKNIKNLDVSSNDLLSLNIHNSQNTKINLFNSKNNPNLKKICVDLESYAKTNFTNTDSIAIFSDINCATTLIPDIQFENRLIESQIDKNGFTGTILNLDAAKIDSLIIDGLTIKSLKGIECFKSLSFLSCRNNQIESIDSIIGIQSLMYVNCDSNLIKGKVNLSNLELLKYLSCHSNNIDALDLNSASQLVYWDCSNNNLKSLKLDSKLSLEYLNCSHNKIESLLIPRQSILKGLDCAYNSLKAIVLTSLPNLEELVCNNNQFGAIDLSFNSKIKKIDASSNKLVYLNLFNGNNQFIEAFNSANNENLKVICVDNELYANSNFLSKDIQSKFSQTNCHTTLLPDSIFETELIRKNIDLSGYTGTILNQDVINIEELDVSRKGIKTIKGIEAFGNIKSLTLDFNPVDTIDLAFNSELVRLKCSNNSKLKHLNLSSNLNLENLECSSVGISKLDVSMNLKLKRLICNFNQNIEFNIDNNTQLDSLEYNGCFIKTLNLSNNTKLKHLHCGDNQISNLDLTNQQALVSLYCMNNALKKLDFSNNKKLEILEAYSNQLSSIDLSINTALKSLFCSNNVIKGLNLSKNINLENLDCRDNELIGLNLQNAHNDKLIYLSSTGNQQLKYICVDDANMAKKKFTYKDITCQYLDGSCTLSSDNLESKEVKVYPNPSNGNLKIESEMPIVEIIVRNLLGEVTLKIQNSTDQQVLLINDFTPKTGMYYIDIVTDKATIRKMLLIH